MLSTREKKLGKSDLMSDLDNTDATLRNARTNEFDNNSVERDVEMDLRRMILMEVET